MIFFCATLVARSHQRQGRHASPVFFRLLSAGRHARPACFCIRPVNSSLCPS